MSVVYSGAESRDASALPCTGIRGTINVVDIHTSIPSGGVMAAWVALELANNNWAQIGYYETNGGLEGFYQLWNLNTDTEIPNSGGTWTASTGSHQFTIVYSGSGTVWDFLMDGVLKGSYDLGTNVSGGTGSSQPFEALVEQYGATFTVPNIEFFTAFQSQQSGTWHDVVTATVYDTASFGVQGQRQNAALASNEIIVGSSIPQQSNGTLLWSASTGLQSTTITITVTQA